MTRDEFHQQWFDYCDQQKFWSRTVPNNPIDCKYLWWENPVSRSWRLTAEGCLVLSRIPHLAEHKQRWATDHMYTSALVMKASKIQCPWFMGISTHIDNVRYIASLVLFGEKENMWMTLCGGDLAQFLNTWTGE
jgi:hypothetical protein